MDPGIFHRAALPSVPRGFQGCHAHLNRARGKGPEESHAVGFMS